MKSKFVVMLIALVTIPIAAQQARWSTSISVGEQFAAQDAGSGLSFSLSADFALTTHFGLAMSVASYEGKVSHTYHFDNATVHSRIHSPFQIVSVGPQFRLPLGPDSLLYADLMLGYSLGSTSGDVTSDAYFFHAPNEHHYVRGVPDSRKNEFTAGAVLGFRHFFGKTTGLQVTASYNHYSGFHSPWDSFDPLTQSDYYALRAGVVFRF